ncbi:MAG: succinylglutamate desuccinylase/aspartoacylase family protein [Crocosphaera sp.]
MKLSTIKTEDFEINIFDTNLSGINLCIVGGVHGNELCGVQTIAQINNRILQDSLSFKGRIVTIVANSQAIQKNKRFIDWDLNRAFGQPSAFGHEKHLAQELITYLQDIDYLIDLHSTSASTKPFCAGKLTDKHLKLFSMTGIKIYTHGWELHRGHSMLIDAVDRLGGIGVIVECGQNNAVMTNQVAYNVVENVINNIMMKQSMIDLSSQSEMIIKIEKIIKAQSNQFSFVRHFENFTPIMADEIVAYDNGTPIKVSDSFVMVMPTYGNLQSGDEAFAVGLIL